MLEDVTDYPRFAGNAVVDEFGIRSYMGAPLTDGTGMVLGTVAVSDVRPRGWGSPASPPSRRRPRNSPRGWNAGAGRAAAVTRARRRARTGDA